MKSSDPPVIVEHTFNTSMQKVWSAITELDEMKHWYFDQLEDRVFTHFWEVNQVIPEQKITYNWKFLEYPGNGDVTFELIPKNDCIKLRLIVDTLKNYPDHIPEFKRESCIQGWEYFIGQNLKEYLHS